jgi:hypothetical protein
LVHKISLHKAASEVRYIVIFNNGSTTGRAPSGNKWPSGQRGEPRARTYHLTNANDIRYDVQKSFGSPPPTTQLSGVRAEHLFY